MYWTSHCLQLLRVKSVSERKLVFYKTIQLIELDNNASGLNLISCKPAEIYK